MIIIIRSYYCKCQAGLQLDLLSNTCIPLDECALKSGFEYSYLVEMNFLEKTQPKLHDCDAVREQCVNSNEETTLASRVGYECRCASGWMRTGLNNCEDLNECISQG